MTAACALCGALHDVDPDAPPLAFQCGHPVPLCGRCTDAVRALKAAYPVIPR